MANFLTGCVAHPLAVSQRIHLRGSLLAIEKISQYRRRVYFIIQGNILYHYTNRLSNNDYCVILFLSYDLESEEDKNRLLVVGA